MRLANGTSGDLSTAGQLAELVAERYFTVALTQGLLSVASESCYKASPSGNCINNLTDFQQVWYAALPEQYRPVMADYAFSDAAFARMRLTVDPLNIKAVSQLPAGVNAAGEAQPLACVEPHTVHHQFLCMQAILQPARLQVSLHGHHNSVRGHAQ